LLSTACLSGRSVFFTGSAGTGKSFLLRKIISTLPPDGTVVTASTGVAACLIGGVTLHSFAGVGGGEHSLKRSVELASRQVAASQWRKCKRLIIDEISMVDASFFDLIEAVAKEIRRNDKPFGGIQLILCGDFFQLPPVIKMDKGNIFEAKNRQTVKRFCFQAKSWSSCIQNSFELRKIYRQKDPKFVEILNSIRIGRVTPEITEKLLSTAAQKIESNGIVATRLCSHTKDADSINQSKLLALKSPEKVFEATDSDIYLTKTLDSQLPVPHKLILKIGAQVMLLKNLNLSNGLVNGARGVVHRFSDGFPVVKFKNNVELTARPEKWVIKTPTGNVLQRKQIPLKLAWAFSIHKSQGLTLDCLEMSLSKVFEAGQAYVALSRAQSLDSLRILDFDAKQVFADPVVLQFYRNFRRMIMEMPVYIPLGGEKKKSNAKDIAKGLKLTKSIMNKPLMTIN
jgi:ATP-dependent DNA helicase PIF1